MLKLNGALEKNNTGVDLRQLFIGSEGTLGVITEATLKLTRLPGETKVLLFAVDSLAGGAAAVREGARRALHGDGLRVLHPGLPRTARAATASCSAPFDAPSSHYVLLEVEAGEASSTAGSAELLERGLVKDGTLAQSHEQAGKLWAYREGISESLSATGLPHKNDIALPIAKLRAFCAELVGLLARSYPDYELCLFGHIGDGNLHVNIMKPDALEKDVFLAPHPRGGPATSSRWCKAHQGSISAEHGVGLLKKEWLGYSRSPEELELMRQLKGVLDPDGILNPGKVL